MLVTTLEVVEYIGSKALDEAVKIVIDKVNAGDKNSVIKKQISGAFTNALKRYVPYQEDIREKERRRFIDLIVRIENAPDSDPLEKGVPEEDLKFFKFFEEELSQTKEAYSYLSEQRSRRRAEKLQTPIDRIDTQTAINSDKLDSLVITVKEILDNINPRGEEEIPSKEISGAIQSILLQDLKLTDCYLNRTIYFDAKNIDRSGPSILIERLDDTYTILSSIKEGKDLMLLGNPGLGKTIELSHTALALKESGNYIPVFKLLKNYTKDQSLKEFLGFELIKDSDNFVFILDGIDETPDFKNFGAKLNSFKTMLKAENKKAQFVISCRTSVYSSQLIFDSFEHCYLSELKYSECKALLECLIGKPLSLDENRTLEKLRDSLVNPLQIKLISDHYKEYDFIQSNPATLWYNYIEERLSIDKSRNIKNSPILIPRIKKSAQRLALVNELTMNNYSSEDELYLILNQNDDLFQELLDTLILDRKSKKLYFEHRNIQEYLVAKVLSDKPLEVMLKFLVIPGTSIIYTALYNVVSFLIQIIEDKGKLNGLIEWLINNQLQLIIKAEFDRITDEIRAKVFQEVFHNTCIEKRLWISTNTSFAIDELGRFSNCKENSTYLINFILDIKNHFRIRGSALNILSFHDQFDKSDLAAKYLELLKLDGDMFSLTDKSNLIRSIYDLRLERADDKIIRKVIDLFEEESNKELNSSILNLLTLVESVDVYFDYLQREFRWSHDIVERKEMDDVHRGNSWKVNNLILELQDATNFAELASYFFDHYQVKASPDFTEKLLKRVKYFDDAQSGFVLELVKRVEKNVSQRNHQNEDLLVLAINETNANLEAFKLIFKEETFHERKWLLARISNEPTIDYLVENLNEPQELIEHLNGFRNILFNTHFSNGPDLAQYFVRKIEKRDIKFDDNSPTREEYELLKEKRIQKIQDDFELLFNRSKLIEKIFTHFDGDQITMKDWGKIRMKYFEIPENHHSDTTSDIDALHLLLRENDPLPKSNVEKEIDNDVTILKLLKGKLEIRKDRSDKFNFDSKKEEIEKLVESVAKSTKLNELIVYKDHNSFYYTDRESYEAYQTIKVLHYFLDSSDFDPTFSDSFILDSMEYYRLEVHDESNHEFSKFVGLIGDIQARNEKIIDNIKRGIFSFSWKRHVVYALNNGITEVNPILKDYFRRDNNIYSTDSLFRLYLDKTADNSLLEEMVNDLSVQSGWTALELLLENDMVGNRKRFVEAAKKSLESETNSDFISNAIQVLFECNDEKAFIYYVNHMDNERVQTRGISRIKSYNAIKKEKYPSLIIFFNKIHKLGVDKFEFSYHKELLMSIINNISSEEEGYEELKRLFVELKENILKSDPKLESKENDSKTFYVNLILDNMEKSFISSLSEPFTFEKALEKTNEILPLT